jgi:hypothetical protein
VDFLNWAGDRLLDAGGWASECASWCYARARAIKQRRRDARARDEGVTR